MVVAQRLDDGRVERVGRKLFCVDQRGLQSKKQSFVTQPIGMTGCAGWNGFRSGFSRSRFNIGLSHLSEESLVFASDICHERFRSDFSKAFSQWWRNLLEAPLTIVYRFWNISYTVSSWLLRRIPAKALWTRTRKASAGLYRQATPIAVPTWATVHSQKSQRPWSIIEDEDVLVILELERLSVWTTKQPRSKEGSVSVKIVALSVVLEKNKSG